MDFMLTIIAIGFIIKSSDDDLQSYKNNTNKYKINCERSRDGGTKKQTNNNSRMTAYK